MNRADAIDLDEQNKQLKSELSHAKSAFENANKILKSTEEKVAKGEFLIKAMHTAYQSGQDKVVSEASNKLLEVIKAL